jgi:hypothetical protein
MAVDADHDARDDAQLSDDGPDRPLRDTAAQLAAAEAEVRAAEAAADADYRIALAEERARIPWRDPYATPKPKPAPLPDCWEAGALPTRKVYGEHSEAAIIIVGFVSMLS